MPNSKSGTAPPENNTHSVNNGKEQHRGDRAQNNGTDAGEYGVLVEQAKVWVEGNQTAAMLSGFGFGVFIGVLLRR